MLARRRHSNRGTKSSVSRKMQPSRNPFQRGRGYEEAAYISGEPDGLASPLLTLIFRIRAAR